MPTTCRGTPVVASAGVGVTLRCDRVCRVVFSVAAPIVVVALLCSRGDTTATTTEHLAASSSFATPAAAGPAPGPAPAQPVVPKHNALAVPALISAPAHRAGAALAGGHVSSDRGGASVARPSTPQNVQGLPPDIQPVSKAWLESKNTFKKRPRPED